MLTLFSLPVIERMLKILHHSHLGVNRTNLATKCRLNYGTCIRYIELLSRLGWVSIVYYGRGSQVVLTEKGVEYARTMLSETNENTDKMASCLNSASNSESFIGDFTPGLIGGNAPGIEIDQVISTTGNRTKGSVMIVDDEADVLMTYKLHLTERGFEVYAFRDPVLATKVFRRDARQIDVVLLDLRMAQMNGIQVFQKLKGIRPDVNIIFISGLDAAPELTSALPGLQSTDVFSKPVDLDKLTDKLCAVVSRKKMNT